MSTVKTYDWDIAEHLDSEEAIQAYLDACLEENDPKLLAAALGDIAKARGMAQVARDAGMGRESLYKALSPEGNPELGTILNILKALGLRLHVGAAI